MPPQDLHNADYCWLRCNQTGTPYRPFRIDGDPWLVYSCTSHAHSRFKQQWIELKKRLDAHNDRVTV